MSAAGVAGTWSSDDSPPVGGHGERQEDRGETKTGSEHFSVTIQGVICMYAGGRERARESGGCSLLPSAVQA